MIHEEWKPIIKFENFYQISNLGNIKSVDRYVQNKKSFMLCKGKVLKTYISKKGYLCVQLSIKNKRKTLRISRGVAEAFIPNPLNLSQVNHKDGNKLNNCVLNLEWCSPKQNTIHAVQNNLIKSGSKHHSCKFNTNDVENILKLHSNGYNITQIYSIFYPIAYRTISNVINRKTYHDIII